MTIRMNAPIRDGDTFCSPACGLGCHVSSYEVAQRHAKELVSKLWPTWTGSVWEGEEGWRAKATSPSGIIEVRHGPVYKAAVVINGTFPHGKWYGTGRTPRAALRTAFGYAFRDRGGGAARFLAQANAEVAADLFMPKQGVL